MAIKLNLDGWLLTHIDTQDPEVQQYDNETSPLVIVGDIPVGWTWQALIAYDELLNVVLLTPTEGGLEAQMSASDLALAGIYTIQLRGSVGTAVRRTNKVSVNVPSSLNGDAQWPEVPTAFQQALDAAIAAAEDSEDSAKASDLSAQASAGSAEDSEAYAAGTRGGTPVTSGDPAYENNAKYYADSAADSAAIASAMIQLDFHINSSGHLIAERSVPNE